ncbi:MAG: uridine kinase [Candidatus Omnitrophica bacterium]|nr:uridine kinase [Candidatus Omnitrophota bacterium]
MLIAIAGPTASGKTTLANLLKKILGANKAVIISQDNYYKDWPRLSLKERKKINFDNLKSFDWVLLLKHLKCLKKGNPILSPEYDFVQSRRLKKAQKVEAKQFIIVEGLIPYFEKKLRSLFDYKIYINTNNGICLARRIKRDTQERADSIESVCKRYFEDVLPMQKKYVEPQKGWADWVVEGI